MAGSDWQEKVRVERLRDVIKKRYLSFLSIYSVVAIVIALMLMSVKWRQIPCQKSAKYVDLVLMLPIDVSKFELWGPVVSVLDDVGLHADTRQMEVQRRMRNSTFIDTPGHAVRDASMLLKSTSGLSGPLSHQLSLRYVTSDLCADRPPQQLSAEYNAEAEVADHTIRSVYDGQTRRFLFEYVVRTSDADRLKTSSDMSRLFPALRATAGAVTQPLITERAHTVETLLSSRLYTRTGAVLPSMKLQLEKWHDSKTREEFQVLRLVFRSKQEEALAVRTFQLLHARLGTRRMLCQRRCGVPLLYLV